KKIYPNSKGIIFGKTHYKMNHFSFAEDTSRIDEIPEDLTMDHAIECTGGNGSKYAIDQIIDVKHHEATVCLVCVNEYQVETNTRMILEKGLTFIGSSRSGSKDFQNTVDIYSEHPDVVEYLSTLVGSLHTVENTGDLIKAFEEDLSSSWGKTVMRWKM